MKKFIILCLLGLLSVASLWADDKTLCFTVVGTDGSETYFAVDEAPLVSYEHNTMMVALSDSTFLEVRLDDVEECHFTNTTPTYTTPTDTGLGAISMSSVISETVDLTRGIALVSGLEVGAQVYVYTAGGQTIMSVEAPQSGSVSVDFNSLKSGQVYILHTPTTSFKIIK